ncbi:hypothetical protein [Xanthomonas citri]|uniref:hypothetical protein n=1 Tax=Xanthomonas citri TaxID=346 RepID=UPI0010406B27|nr:hypothetical protein [Xanthomonas citri]
MSWSQLFALFVGLAILAALAVASALRPKARERRHRRRQDQARRVLAKINTIPLMPQRLAYLRKIDPLTFEELLLETFERRGYRVIPPRISRRQKWNFLVPFPEEVP